MGSKFEFDDTREQIGVDKLDEDERKNLLNQFKSAGGKVLKEHEVQKPEPSYADEKQRHRHSSSDFSDERESHEDAPKKKVSGGAMTEKQMSSSFALFRLRLHSMFSRITRFNGRSVRPSMMELLAVDLRQALVEFNLLGNDLFMQYPRVGKKIVKVLDSHNSLQMEAIERLHKLFEKKDFDSISVQYETYMSSDTPIDLIFPALKTIYAKLYVLYPYQNTIKKAFHQAMDVYLSEKTDSNKADVNSKKKRVSKDVDLIFLDIFPRMLTLISLYDKMNYPAFSRALEKTIGLKKEDRLGHRSAGESSLVGNVSEDESETSDGNDEAQQENKTDETSTEEENPMLSSKEYVYGIKLMDTIDIKQKQKQFDSKNKFHLLRLNDRAYLAYLFFFEFDQEYSLVLTTNQIKLNIVTESNGAKKDYKRLLSDLYDESRKIHTSLENYYGVREKLIENQKNPITSNYVENSKNLASLQSRVDIEGRSLRGMVRNYMNSLVIALGELIADMKEARSIVINPKETLNFNQDIEGQKRMNGKTVENAIIESYCYALALKERLEGGDLFGGILEMTEEEMQQSFGKSLLTKSE